MWEDGREGRAGGGSEAYTQGFVDNGFFTYAVATDMLRKCAGYTENFQCGIAVPGVDSSTLQILASHGQFLLEVSRSNHSRATDLFFFARAYWGGRTREKGSHPAWFCPRREGAETGVVGMAVVFGFET